MLHRIESNTMSKLKIHIVHYKDVFEAVGIIPNHAHIEEFLNGGRQDILENFDIFTENVRSIDKTNKNFDLFEIVDTITDDCVIVVGFYIELLEYWGQRNRIYDVVKYYSKKYPNNKIVIQWNHDTDSADVFPDKFMDEFVNLYVLNFNSSINHKRYILLPFWTIDEKDVCEEKKYLANIVCSFNNSLRMNIGVALSNNPNIIVSSRIEFDKYKKILSGSKFTLCPRGLGLSSYRFFECFHLNTIPVLFSDIAILPYQDSIDYTKFIVRIPESKSNDANYILERLHNVDYYGMIGNMNTVKEKFTLKGVQEEIYRRLI